MRMRLSRSGVSDEAVTVGLLEGQPVQHRDARGAVRFGLVAAFGLVASVLCALLTGPLQTRGARLLLGAWWQDTAGLSFWRSEPHSFGRGGVYVLLAAAALIAAWLLGVGVLRRSQIPARWVAGVAALWALPVSLTPPSLSRDAYAYLAQGAVTQSGGSPYRSPVAVLGVGSPLVRAVDPLYRAHIAPYGPAGLRLFGVCLALAHHRPALALAVLRLVTIGCVAFCAWACARFAPPGRRALAIWAVAASPLVLLHLVNGLHLEAEVCAVLVAALVMQARGTTRVAAALVVCAAALKITALVVLPLLVLRTLRGAGVRRAAEDVGVAAASAGALALALTPDPFGWLRALSAPLKVWNPISLPTAAAMGWSRISGHSPLATIPSTRLVLAAVGVTLAVWLSLTRPARPLPATAGLLLAAVTLTGPVLWPWYLAPAAICLVLGADRGAYGLSIGLSCAGALNALPMPVRQMQRVSLAADALALAVAVTVAVLLRQRRGLGLPARASMPSGPRQPPVAVGGPRA
ncbi:MAG: hypothetical protein NVSMB55_25610 [Mycobacteriales bacterium]